MSMDRLLVSRYPAIVGKLWPPFAPGVGGHLSSWLLCVLETSQEDWLFPSRNHLGFVSSCDTGHATVQLPTPLNACSLKWRACAVSALSSTVALISRAGGLLLIHTRLWLVDLGEPGVCSVSSSVLEPEFLYKPFRLRWTVPWLDHPSSHWEDWGGLVLDWAVLAG